MSTTLEWCVVPADFCFYYRHCLWRTSQRSNQIYQILTKRHCSQLESQPGININISTFADSVSCAKPRNWFCYSVFLQSCLCEEELLILFTGLVSWNSEWSAHRFLRRFVPFQNAISWSVIEKERSGVWWIRSAVSIDTASGGVDEKVTKSACGGGGWVTPTQEGDQGVLLFRFIF